MIKNATQPPKIFYGLHMAEGVAEYREPGEDPFRILIGEKALKNMDPTFTGCPIYVLHVEDVSVEEIGKANPDDPEGKTREVGYVVESFFNQADGKHWVKFIIIQDEGHQAIARKWKLSNAYKPGKDFGLAGEWHGVPYQREVRSGRYEHLAIVPNPRYTESVILTPEEFKAYNENKMAELERLANSKQEEEETEDMGKEKAKAFSFWKREKVKNEADLEGVCVQLPTRKIDVTVEEAIEIADKAYTNAYHCNGDERVKVGEGEMSVNELVAAYGDMKNAEGEDDESMENEEDEEESEEKGKKAVKNGADKASEEDEEEVEEDEEDDKASKSKKNSKQDDEDEDEDDEDEKVSHMNALRNAHKVAAKVERTTLETMSTGVQRGISNYGK